MDGLGSLTLLPDYLAVDILIQIPIQVELDKRFSLVLIDRLISTDLIYRRIPMAFLAGINFAMLYKVLRQSGSQQKESKPA